MKITVLEGTKRYEVPFSEGSTILAALQTAGVQSITAPCGGNGTCRKCSVNVQSSSFSGRSLRQTFISASSVTNTGESGDSDTEDRRAEAFRRSRTGFSY